MTVTEHHDAPIHYLFNTDIVEADVSLFDNTSIYRTSSSGNGRGTVDFKSLRTSAGSLKVVIKEYHRGGMVRHFNRRLYWHRDYNQSRVWLEFKLLVKMTSMRLPVPVPVAGRVKRKFPQWYESTIITQEVENSMTLADCLKRQSASSLHNNLWGKTGETIKRFHSANIYHADLNASNILVTASEDIYLIDFDKGCFMPDSQFDWKVGNLDRLQRSLLKYQRADDQFQYSDENWHMLLTGYGQ